MEGRSKERGRGREREESANTLCREKRKMFIAYFSLFLL